MADLVVDASVARSCGDLTATKSPAPECRDFLLAMKDHRHKIVMTKEIKAEWDKHQSGFATRWLSQMVGKKLFQPVSIPNIDQAIWNLIEKMAKTDKERAAMVKDILLLEAALATGQRIASLDEKTARRYFTKAAQKIEKLQPLIWVNPNKPEEDAITWLQNGAPSEETKMLGYIDPAIDH